MDTPVIDMHSHVGNEGRVLMNDDPDTYVSILDAKLASIRAPVCCFW